MFMLVNCETARRQFIHQCNINRTTTETRQLTHVTLPVASVVQRAERQENAPVEYSVNDGLRLQIPRVSCPQFGETQNGTVAATSAREQVRVLVDSCLNTDVKPKTVDRYQGVIQATFVPAEGELSMRLLPMDSEDKFLALFGHLRLRRGAELRWSYVRLVKAAILKWRRRSNEACVLDEWSDAMRLFWAGFKRQCNHAGMGKAPVEFNELTQFLAGVAKHLDCSTTLRNATMTVTAFFGVRRSAEIIGFDVEDLEIVAGHGCWLKVHSQKNDQLGGKFRRVGQHFASIGFRQDIAIRLLQPQAIGPHFDLLLALFPGHIQHFGF